MRLSEILSRKSDPFVSLPPTASVLQAARSIQSAGGAVVVCDRRGRVLGVVSEQDLARAVAAMGREVLELCVDDVMTVDVPAATPHTAVQSVLRIMIEQRARHMPVIENGVAVGMVSFGDLLTSRPAKRFTSPPIRGVWREAGSRPERGRYACPPFAEASHSWKSRAPVSATA